MELTIEKLIYGGDGLARLAADEQGRRKAVFLPFVLEGERVDATMDILDPGKSAEGFEIDVCLRGADRRVSCANDAAAAAAATATR